MKYFAFIYITTILLSCSTKKTMLFDIDKVNRGDFIASNYASESATLPYRILFPTSYKVGEKLPVILFLHGAGERGDDNEAQLVHGRDFLAENANSKGAIIVAPQCVTGGYWSEVEIVRDSYPLAMKFDITNDPTPQLKLVMDLVQELKSEPYVNTDQISVIGLSMGGMGSFELISRMPNTFKSAVPICGGGDPRSVNKYTDQTKVWIFHGGKDGVVDVKQSDMMVQALRKKNARVKYTIFPTMGHNSWDSVWVNPDVFDFLVE